MSNGVVAKLDAQGNINVRTELDGKISRRVVVPGMFTDAVTFVATDLTSEPQEVKNEALKWTPQFISAWKDAHPYVAPYTDPDKPRKDALLADANVILLMQRAKENPSQIDTWLTANVTTLPQFRNVLGAVIKYIALTS